MTATNGASLMGCLNEIDDPRKPSNGTLHDLREILVIAIAATLSDSDTGARKKEAWQRRFLELKNGIPSEETFLRIFRALDPKQFEAVFRRWVSGVVGALGGTIAVDGRTVRGSGTGGETAIHMVSAFATELGVVLGQEKTARKSNEITAIPELLEALYLKDFLVSIDAMACQKDIARQITAQGGDYLLAVKGNQPALLKVIQAAFLDRKESEAVDRQGRVEKSHGRIVGQVALVLAAPGVVDPAEWPQCKPIGLVDAIRHVADHASDWEQRYYISSRKLNAEQLAAPCAPTRASRTAAQGRRCQLRRGWQHPPQGQRPAESLS